MNTSTPRVLSGGEVRALSVRSNARGAARTALHVGALLLAGVGVALSGPWTLLPATLLLGVVQAALFAPVHETMHQTVFRNRRANVVVGWLAACPSLLNWHFYAAFHQAHHRFTQDPERDPELAPPPPGSLDTYLLRVLGVNYWRARAAVIRNCLRGDLSGYAYIPAATAPRVVFSVRAMCVSVAAVAAGSAALFGWWVPLAFWILPQLLGQPLLRLYLLTEHTECALDANDLTNTRTTLTNGLMRLLMWNMSFHAEHHLYPSIPFHRLPDAHAVLHSRLGVVQDGYARWHQVYLTGILRRA
jgi:fatty acid desaturase